MQLQAPGHVVNHLPSFQHEEVVEIATDLWGSQGREILSIGGPTPPALGLVRGDRLD